MECVGARYCIDLGGDLNNNNKNEIMMHIGLRRPPIDHFTHYNQPKKSWSGIGR